ncbi:MAG: ABC transporter substrate-binding protein [Myxococcota bacterium]
MGWSRIVIAGSAFGVGCSLFTVRPADCTSNQQCRDSFGFGSVCGDDGLCATTEIPDRCQTRTPADLAFPLDPSTHPIGTLFDHTLDTHIGRYRSVDLATGQANGNGGLDGESFVTIHCTIEEGTGYDDLTKSDAAVTMGDWLANEVGVPAIVGPAASSDTEAVYNAVSLDYGTLLVSPSATSPSLTTLDGLSSTDADPGLLWRTAPPDDLQGIAIAWDMNTNTSTYRPEPPQRVAVIYQTGAYGEGLEATFTDAFAGYGGEATPFPFESAGGPSEAIAEAAFGFDEVLFISSDVGDVVAFLLGAKNLASFQDLPLFLTDAARNTDVLTEAADASGLFDQIRGTGPANPSGTVFTQFASAYGSKYGGDDVSVLSFTAQSYDAAWLVMYGHAWARYQEDAITGTTIARGLRRVSSGPPIDIRPLSWNDVKAQFAEHASIDVVGASGDLDYDPVTAETTAPIDVWVIVGDDTFLTVENVDPE